MEIIYRRTGKKVEKLSLFFDKKKSTVQAALIWQRNKIYSVGPLVSTVRSSWLEIQREKLHMAFKK